MINKTEMQKIMSEIKNFLVCGGGMMGSAIAQILAGLDDAKVTVYDVFPVNVEQKFATHETSCRKMES